MENFLEVLKEILNACVECVSRYVHSPEALIIDTKIGQFTKEALDMAVDLTREFLDIFGR